MKALKFKLSGKTAFFKKPEVNTYVYFTYGNIHKVALLGLFGAILGYDGYIQLNNKEENPEFYNKLREVKVAICPNEKKGGAFGRKTQSFNNSVGYASKEEGGNLIVKQQWLDNPSWDIYVMLDNNISESLKEKMLKHECEYIPYLGNNAHPACITNEKIVECTLLDNKESVSVNSIYISDNYIVDEEIEETEETIFKYTEMLPIGLEESTNRYIFEKFSYSNLLIVSGDSDIYSVEEKNVVFF